jgi:hypothetical protein
MGYYTSRSTSNIREICMIWLPNFWRRLSTLLNGRNSSERRRTMGKKVAMPWCSVSSL